MKALNCRDCGADCDYEVRGRTIDEVLKKAGAHAMKDHGMKEVSKSDLDFWRMKVHDV